MAAVSMTNCPNCDERKGNGYLCRRCWFGLGAVTRKRLLRRDRFALERLRELYDQIGQKVPLAEIEVRD